MSLTSTSRRPCSASMRWTSASTCAGSRWSTSTAIPLPPAASTSSAVSSIVSGRSYSERRCARRATGAVDRRARLSQRDRRAAPGAAGRARHERHLPCQRIRHRHRTLHPAVSADTEVVAARWRSRPAARSAEHEHGTEDERPAGELHRAERLAEREERQQDRGQRLGRREDRGGRRADAPEAGEEQADGADGRDDRDARQPSEARQRSRRPGAGRRRRRPPASASSPRRCRPARSGRAGRRARRRPPR